MLMFLLGQIWRFMGHGDSQPAMATMGVWDGSYQGNLALPKDKIVGNVLKLLRRLDSRVAFFLKTKNSAKAMYSKGVPYFHRKQDRTNLKKEAAYLCCHHLTQRQYLES